MTKLVEEIDVKDKTELKKKMKKTKDKNKIKNEKEVTDMLEDADIEKKVKKKKFTDTAGDTNIEKKVKKNKKVTDDDITEDADMEKKVKKKKGKDVSEDIEDTHEVSNSLEKRLLSISNETVSEMQVDNEEKVDKFETTAQKERLEKKKQKRKDKKQKQKDKANAKASTENVLWKKLKQVQKGTDDIDTTTENVSIENEQDPVKKAIREKKRNKRQEKRVQKQKLTEDNLERAGTAGAASIEYLHTWENDREEWKFQTVRQVWLMRKMYDNEQINDDDFEILLRYLEPTNDKVKKQLVKEAEEIIQKIENDLENADQEEETVTSYKMDRARQVIQLLAV